jgi:hypothetical protein
MVLKNLIDLNLFIIPFIIHIKYIENILNIQSQVHDRQPFTKSGTCLKLFNSYRVDN